ncbi:MAG: alpha-glucosidase, partial [Erysipelotrichaceae bacterium]|nr:alpha-glucosidase [Erysipelotrichaceae bacterium]
MEYWKQLVGYQIYPRSFKDSNHDGIGDLQGIISKLDYLQELGVGLIWICPTFASPMDDNGYDISDYEDMHPDYGTMDDMKELIQEADKRGMKIMLDLVMNHTSDEHRWFKEALANPESKYRNYYYFMEGEEAPCNWRSIFGGPVWEKVGDNLYYFHAFSKRQPDLNWRNPEMRQEMFGIIKRWMEIGIAGFRVDAINIIKKAPFESHPADGPDGLVSCFEYTRNVKGIEELYEELSECFRANNCVTVSEAIGAPYEELDIYIGEQGTFSMMFDFNYTNIDVENEDYFKKRNWTIKEYRDLIYESQSKIQLKGWSAPFLENHDQPRSVNKLIKNPAYYKEGAKALGMMNLLMRGTPFIYQGEELGTLNFKRSSVDEFDDLNARSQYNQSLAAGFSEQQSVQFLNERSRD